MNSILMNELLARWRSLVKPTAIKVYPQPHLLVGCDPTIPCQDPLGTPSPRPLASPGGMLEGNSWLMAMLARNLSRMESGEADEAWLPMVISSGSWVEGSPLSSSGVSNVLQGLNSVPFCHKVQSTFDLVSRKNKNTPTEGAEGWDASPILSEASAPGCFGTTVPIIPDHWTC